MILMQIMKILIFQLVQASSLATLMVIARKWKKVTELLALPHRLRDKDWFFFSHETNPPLSDFLNELSIRKFTTYAGEKVSRSQLESKLAYDDPLVAGEDFNEIEFMDNLTRSFCQQGLEKVYSLALRLLTSLNGDWSEGKFSIVDQQKLLHTVGNNILGPESSFGNVGAVMMILGKNLEISTCEGIVLGHVNGHFEKMEESHNWNTQLIGHCMAFAKKNLQYFLKQEVEKKVKQEVATQERLKEIAEGAMKGAVVTFRKAISLYGLSQTFSFITTVNDFQEVLNLSVMQDAKNKLKAEFCKLFIYLEYFAYGDKQVKKEMSSVSNTRVGTLPDLIDRCTEILQKQRVSSVAPPISATSYSDCPPMATQQYNDLLKDTAQQMTEMQGKILQRHRDFCVNLRWSYNDLQTTDFECVQLTENQIQFKVGRVFALDDDEFIVRGLSWDKKQGDYCLWYHDAILNPPPTIIDDPAVYHIYFKNYTAGRGNKRGEVAGLNNRIVTWLNY